MPLKDHLQFWEYHQCPVITFDDGKKEWVFCYRKMKDGSPSADFIKKNATPLSALDYEKKYGDLIYVHEMINLKFSNDSSKPDQNKRIQLLEKIIQLYEKDLKYKPVPVYIDLGDNVIILFKTLNANSVGFQFSPYGIQKYNVADAMWKGDVISRELACDKVDQMSGSGKKGDTKKPGYYDQFTPPSALYTMTRILDQFLSLKSQQSYVKEAIRQILKIFKKINLVQCPFTNKQLMDKERELQQLICHQNNKKSL